MPSDENRVRGGNGTERTWASLWCLLLGHNWYPELTWQIENDASHRKLWGDLCRRCHRFQPRENGKERFKNDAE